MLSDAQGILALIKETSSITSLLGTFKGSSEPLAVVGTIPEGQYGLPAISIRQQTDIGWFGITESIINIVCYAKDEPSAYELAGVVHNTFRDSVGGVNSYASKFESTITAVVPEKEATGIVVEIKADHR